MDRAAGGSRSLPWTLHCCLPCVAQRHPVQENRSWAKQKQEALGQITQGSCAWCRNPEDPQAQRKTEIRTAAGEGRLEGPWEVELSSLSRRALRHWMKIKADTCPSTFPLSFLSLCMSPETMQHKELRNGSSTKACSGTLTLCSASPCPQARPQGNKHPEPCSPGSHSWAVPRAGPPEQAEQGNPSWRGNHQKKLGLSSCITQSLLTASSSQTVASTLRRNPWGRSALEAAEKEGGLCLLTPGMACPARPPRLPRRRPHARWPWCAAGARGPGSAPAPGPA